MDIGMVGLGRMGGNMAIRLSRGGHTVIAYDQDSSASQISADEGIGTVQSLEELVDVIKAPRAIWAMVPSGSATEDLILNLATVMSKGDTVVDGSNSNFNDSMRRAEMLEIKGINFLDVGTSGGIAGLDAGYSLMVGGKRHAYDQLKPIFETLAPSVETGYGYVGPSGAGHFVKMIHNGIEYGMMQAYAEGFEMMSAKTEFDIDLAEVAEIWRHGSVVRSWLLDLTAIVLSNDSRFNVIEPYVEDSGEGRWTVEESINLAVPIPVITAALQARFRSRQQSPLAPKLLAALRSHFGGHAVRETL